MILLVFLQQAAFTIHLIQPKWMEPINYSYVFLEKKRISYYKLQLPSRNLYAVL